jgi:circadian clock protein KaiC
MAHSNQLREFVLTNQGVRLEDVYSGQEGVLTGASRLAQETKDSADAKRRNEEIERARLNLQRQKQIFEAEMQKLRAEFKREEDKLLREISQMQGIDQQVVVDRRAMARKRQADVRNESNSRARTSK